jgi:hypothetical protein
MRGLVSGKLRRVGTSTKPQCDSERQQPTTNSVIPRLDALSPPAVGHLERVPLWDANVLVSMETMNAVIHPPCHLSVTPHMAALAVANIEIIVVRTNLMASSQSMAITIVQPSHRVASWTDRSLFSMVRWWVASLYIQLGASGRCCNNERLARFAGWSIAEHAGQG